MSENPADRSNEPDDERNEGRHWLTSLLSALESLERRGGSASGRRRRGERTMDYDISLGSLGDASSGDPLGSDRSRRDESPNGISERPRKRRRQPSTTTTSMTTRTYEDELVVTADVAGIDPEEVTVGFDEATLVVGVSGSELDRVDVPWDDRTATATIKNGVLTVTVEPDGERVSDASTGEGR
jgi:HSP20 family molecular chaperone IbpA